MLLSLLQVCSLGLTMSPLWTRPLSPLSVAASSRNPPAVRMATIADAVVEATMQAAEEHAIKAGGGNSGDASAAEGKAPVLAAALAVAQADASLAAAIQHAADKAMPRTNANAETTANAIIIACMDAGASQQPVAASKVDGFKYSAAFQVAQVDSRKNEGALYPSKRGAL